MHSEQKNQTEFNKKCKGKYSKLIQWHENDLVASMAIQFKIQTSNFFK